MNSSGNTANRLANAGRRPSSGASKLENDHVRLAAGAVDVAGSTPDRVSANPTGATPAATGRGLFKDDLKDIAAPEATVRSRLDLLLMYERGHPDFVPLPGQTTEREVSRILRARSGGRGRTDSGEPRRAIASDDCRICR